MLKKAQTILIAGFAMFSMFFGSGNLIFPLLVGVKSGNSYDWAFLGLFLTAVLVPFLGIASVSMFDGDRKEFFGAIGPKVGFLVTFFILSLLGPFAVLPRCTIVAYSGFNFMYPGTHPAIFCSILTILTLLITLMQGKLIHIIGKWLTPILLIAVIYLAKFGIKAPSPVESDGFDSFITGLYTGYETLDLLASFFFAIVVVEYFKRHFEGESESTIRKASMLSGVIGMSLLSAVYITFLMLGNSHAQALSKVAPENLLVSIASLSLGNNAGIIAGCIIILACLTTMVALTSLVADFLQDEIFNHKASRLSCLMLILCLSLAISMSGFWTIETILAKILSFLYPALIALVIGNITYKYFDMKPISWPFWSIVAIMASYDLTSLIASM